MKKRTNDSDDDDHDLDEGDNPSDEDFTPDDNDSVDTRPCPRCGIDVYEDAERCPKCGTYLTKSSGSSIPRWAYIAAIVALVAMTLPLLVPLIYHLITRR
jgi:uncharacterized paraquat-inducible protein A